MSIHTFKYNDKVVHLIDTPAFDDAERSDYETLDEIAFWLTAAYEHSIQINGIVYLHSITDTRMQGAARKSLDILKTLCGAENYYGLVMATTRWAEISRKQKSKALYKQQQLRQDPRFWGDIEEGGGHITSLSASREDALRIVAHIIDNGFIMNLAFQYQLVEEGRRIIDTDTGYLLYEDILGRYEEEYKILEEAKAALCEAVGSQDPERKAELDSYTRKLEQSLQLQEESVRRLSANAESLRKEWSEHLSQDFATVISNTTTDESQATDISSSSDGMLMNDSCLTDNIPVLDAKPPVIPINYRQIRESGCVIALPRRMGNPPLRTAQPQYRTPKKRAEVGVVKKSGDGTYTTLGLIGTALGAGQLVAAMACNVM
jgi:hypothetical protein